MNAELLALYTDEALLADIAKYEGTSAHGWLNIDKALLRLDTPERRVRAKGEGETLTNLIGGITSHNVNMAVDTLLRQIAAGEEDKELYGERTAREYREREANLRKATGNPAAIYYPREFAR